MRDAAAGQKRPRSPQAELFWAARFGRVGLLRELLQQGATVDGIDPLHGQTALTAAVSQVRGHPFGTGCTHPMTRTPIHIRRIRRWQ